MESLNNDKENLILSQIADVLENKCCEVKPFDDEHDIFLSQAVDCFELGMTLSQAVNTYDISETGSFDLGYNEDSLLNTNECFQEFKPKVTSLDLPSTSARFASPVSDNDIMQLKLSQINKNTAKNTNWSFSVFESWRNERSNDIPELHNMGKATMAFWLTRFIMEVRNAKGEEYPPKTLYQLICGLLRHIREKGVYDKNFLDNKDPCFSEFYSILDSRMKDLLQKGHGTTIKQADPITQEDEEKLWNLGVFGVSDPQTLQYTVFFYACKLFGLRGRDEHRDLKCSQFEIDQDKKGKYIRFIGRANKTYKGGLGQMSLTNKDIKHYCAEGPRCLADIFDLYLRALGNEGDFYRRPLASSAGNLRYSNQPIGVNRLALFMKEIAQKGGLKGNFTNHSGKRSCAFQLYNAGVPEQEIMAKTGHRSELAVRKYKRTSDEMLKQVSCVLDPNDMNSVQKQPKIDNSEKKCETTKQGSSSALADITNKAGVINFSGCTFNFS